MQRDPAFAAAEYLAQFRTDIENFIAREVIEACVTQGRYERPPATGVRYFAFVDPSGGSSDSMTLAISHRTSEQQIRDCLREVRPPFSPESVVGEFAALCRQYRISKITGDRYAGEWPREQFRKHGIHYEPSAKPKSDLYRDLLPLLNSRRVELLDDARLISQLCGLERRTGRLGRDTIDHATHQHDDVANAVAGALLLATQRKRDLRCFVGYLPYHTPGYQGPIEIDPQTGRRIDQSPPKIYRAADGTLHLRSDNTGWTSEELRRRRL